MQHRNSSNSLNSNFLEDTIEKKILLQILLVSSLGILFYLLNGILKNNLETTRDSSFAMLVYLGLFVWVYFPGNFLLKKRISSLIMFLSVCSGYFVLGGFKGISAFDLLNMLFFFSVMFQKKEKYTYIIIVGLCTLSFFTLQLTSPELILNRSANDPDWLLALNILIRLSLTFNIGIALKDAYTKEHEKTLALLHEIHELNIEITSQNEELKSMQEDLKSNNDKLEISVAERTKKLEIQNETLIMYAYLNSHIFRGPICRIQGILNLLEIEKDNTYKEQLHAYLMQEVSNIDKVVKDMSKMLYENDEEFIQELKDKAKRLYNF